MRTISGVTALASALALLLGMGAPARAQPWIARDLEKAGDGFDSRAVQSVMIHHGVLFAANPEDVGYQGGPGLPWKKSRAPAFQPDPYATCCYLMAHAGDMIFAVKDAPLRMASGNPDTAAWTEAGSRAYGFAEGAGWVAWTRYAYTGGGKVKDLFTLCEAGTHACRTGTMDFPIRGAWHGMAARGDTLVMAFDYYFASLDTGRTWTKGAAVIANARAVPNQRLAFEGSSLFRFGPAEGACPGYCLGVSEDLGATWTLIDPEGLKGFYPADMVSTPKGLVVAGDSGVFLSGNHGRDWAVLGTGLPLAQVRPLKDLACEGNLLAVVGRDGRPYVLNLEAVSSLAPGNASWRQADPGPARIGVDRFRDAGGGPRTADGRRVPTVGAP